MLEIEAICFSGSQKNGCRFLYKENHAIVAWFQRRLMPMMQKEKLLLL